MPVLNKEKPTELITPFKTAQVQEIIEGDDKISDKSTSNKQVREKFQCSIFSLIKRFRYKEIG